MQYLLKRQVNNLNEIKKAKLAGFCYGVKRAVNLAKDIKDKNPNKKIYILGDLIHNQKVIQDLEEYGIKTVHKIPKDTNGICIIRTHGASPKIIEEITKTGCQVVDATCPDVKKVQQKAAQLAKKSYRVIIVGKAEHPEVKAIKAYADSEGKLPAIVVSEIEQLKKFHKILKDNKIGVVVQTTQKIELLKEITAELLHFAKEIHICNTICPATKKRQKEALKVAKEVELMIVAGSKNSANTTHLAEVLKKIVNTLHIETADALDDYKDLIVKIEKIGITAGASTPKETIENIIKKIGEI